MKTTPEQLAEMKALTAADIDGGFVSRMRVESHHYLQLETFREAIPALIADLEEAGARITQLEIAAVNRSVSSKEASALFALGSAQEERASTCKQLEEAQAKLAAAEKDAARYQQCVNDPVAALDIIGHMKSKADADFDFDAAIAAQEGK